MKSKVSIIIAAFAIIVSFAFITVNKTTEANKNKETVEAAPTNEPMSAYAMEDEGQWD